MAPKKKIPAEEAYNIPPGKLVKLTIWNFRSIGLTPVTIDLDDIVVLVGENNSGKSSILRAYELALCAEEASGKLDIEDFYRGEVSSEPSKQPRIEIETRISGAPPNNEHWRVDGEFSYLRERFTWRVPGETAARETYFPHKDAESDEDRWGEANPWGAAGVRKGKRPKPYRVDAFASPEKRKKELDDLLKSPIDEMIEQWKSGDGIDKNELIAKIQAIRSKIKADAEAQITNLTEAVSRDISEVFPNYQITIDPPATGYELEGLKLFSDRLVTRMGVPGEFQSTIERQGAGAQRTLVWAVLRYLSERDTKLDAKRGRVLLLDEPELCLHPSAVRAACRTLYKLAEGNNGWQVMVSTHSPLFIDLSQKHTTITRITRKESTVSATELFRADSDHFSDSDERKLLKLLNIYDPYVAEFFFSRRTVIVEGDTEYSAFRRIIESRGDLQDVHVVRARGKYLIRLVAKILNQFGASYGVLHDFDSPFRLDKKKEEWVGNNAWTANTQILDECLKAKGDVRLIGAVENFEQALFQTEAKDEKPYEAVRLLSSDDQAFKKAEAVLRVLCGDHPTTNTPTRFIAYNSAEELEKLKKSLTPSEIPSAA